MGEVPLQGNFDTAPLPPPATAARLHPVHALALKRGGVGFRVQDSRFRGEGLDVTGVPRS